MEWAAKFWSKKRGQKRRKAELMENVSPSSGSKSTVNNQMLWGLKTWFQWRRREKCDGQQRERISRSKLKASDTICFKVAYVWPRVSCSDNDDNNNESNFNADRIELNWQSKMPSSSLRYQLSSLVFIYLLVSLLLPLNSNHRLFFVEL